MASYGDQYGRDQGRQTDEFDNPIHHTTGGTIDDYGIGTGATTGTGTGQHNGTQGQQHQGGGVTGVLHRSGSSSSSSSEDDGIGGRRKKGIKDKIKEKLPGGHKEQQRTSTTTQGVGIKDKVMDKLPGGHKEEQRTSTTTPGVGVYGYEGEHGYAGAGAGVGAGQEKKGMIEKIKEKLPGQH